MNRASRALLALLVLAGCDRAKTAAPEATTGQQGGIAPSVAGSGAPWDEIVGSAVATPSVETGTPLLFARDTGSTADIPVELFSHDGRTVRATLRPAARLRSCVWERSAELALTEPQASPPVWSLALEPGTALPLAIDGVVELLPRDSAALVERVSRLVSALADDSASVPFRGLPIVVRDAWRFQAPADSTPIVVAVAVRSLNVESNPRSEVVTIIAQPDPSAGSTAWRTGFARRDAGAEDRVEGADLLAAIQLKNGNIAVALVRESDTGLQVEIVERSTPLSWHVRWSSAALRCARR